MGEVYRAWDPRLHREVALKILREDVAQDPERRRRFLDEARAAGALNHPNILAVYDVSISDGTPYIVTELVDGRELRDEIDRGPLATKRLLELAVQLASGLSAAHQVGIAHRDLKPENVIVTRDGRAKIVDFGLAKSFSIAPAETVGATRATLTLPGVVVGTPHYMSPEQARGGDVDFRSDQFSFGVMLYQMATGSHPFRRETAVQTMSAIITEEPHAIAELNPRTPVVLRWIVERCLSKDPNDRYASTEDLAKDLRTLLGRLSEASSVAIPAASVKPRRRIIPTAAAAAAAVVVGAVAILLMNRDAPPPSMTFRPLVTEGRFQGAPAWAPDGQTIAYVSSVDGILQIFKKSVASPFSQALTESRFNATDPFWSRDGTRIYYHALAQDREGLWSVGAAGGAPEPLILNATGAAISPDGGTLSFFREEDSPQTLIGARLAIWLASTNGDNERRYAEPPFDTRTFVAGTLRFSPDGSKLLAWVWGWEFDKSTIPTPEFWVLPWPTGRPYKVLDSLARAAPAAASFDWLPDGRRIVVSLWDGATTGMHLWTADVERDTITRLTATPGSENRPAVAPDGRSVAFADEEIDFDLVEIPVDGGDPRPLLATSRNELDPSFAPDGSRYAYLSDKAGVLQIWLRSRDGLFEQPLVGPAQFPDDPTLTLGALALSPKGDQIAYQRYAEKSGYQIWISTVAASGTPVQLATGLFYQDAPTWSPNGSEIVFVGRTKTYVAGLMRARVGGTSEPTMILRDVPPLLARPAWSPDGKWIACQTIDGLVIVSPDGTQTRTLSQEGWVAFAWDTDSKRIYGLREAERRGHFALVSLDIETTKEQVINADLGVIPPASQPIRGLTVLSGGSLVTSIASARSDIWIAEGLDRASAGRWWSRFWR
jgi:Tol biopolymer transport system component